MMSAMRKMWAENLPYNAECHGICRSLDELIKSRSVHLNRLAILVSINIKPQKHYLNMNPACSASLLMNDTDVRFH